MRSCWTEPVVAATALNASARPAVFVSRVASVVALPTRTARPGGGGGGGGVAMTVPAAQAEIAPSVNVAPVVHAPSRGVSVATELVSELPAPTHALSRKRNVPPVPSTAIQYVWPAVTLAFGTVIVLNCPATGVPSVPCVSSAPGWFVAEFAYRPAVTAPVEPVSTHTRSCVRVPLEAVDVLNASAGPAGFESSFVWTACVPRMNAAVGAGAT